MAFLIISPESWSAHSVSKHHYARLLANLGHQVFFLGKPDSFFSPIKLESVKEVPGLTVVRSSVIFPGLRFLPRFVRLFLESRWLKKLESISHQKINVIWLFENSRFYDLCFAGSRLKIYHQVDLNQNFNPSIAALTADICFCTTRHIKILLDSYNSRCYMLRHGVSISTKLLQLSTYQDSLFDDDVIHAMYVGNLDMTYLDQDLIFNVISRQPDICFHLVGGYQVTGSLYRRLKQFKNVIWWGQVSSDLIPSLLQKADILMVAYQAEFHVEQANPHKMMEYLSSGKIIVSTYTEEFVEQAHLIAMSSAGTNSAYPQLFATVASDLRFFNSPKMQVARKDFASQNTYFKQLERIKSFSARHHLNFPIDVV